VRLELHDVTYRYPHSDKPALDLVSCRIETGQTIALLGANGSGKSTLARIACGLLKPDTGRVTLNGEELKKDWNGIGLLFQNPDEQLLTASVDRELAWGLENLALPPNEIERRVEDDLKLFNLEEIRHRPPEQLSDGEKQLTALAATVVMNPQFLILDEATAFLDPDWKAHLVHYVHTVAKDTGVLWISTRADEIMDFDEIWIMKAGKIIEQGSTEKVLNSDKLEEAGIASLDII